MRELASYPKKKKKFNTKHRSQLNETKSMNHTHTCLVVSRLPHNFYESNSYHYTKANNHHNVRKFNAVYMLCPVSQALLFVISRINMSWCMHVSYKAQ